MKIHLRKLGAATGGALLTAALLSACGGGGGSSHNSSADNSEPARPQDSRTFTVDQTNLDDFASSTVSGHTNSSRWAGVRPNGAGYHMEVPENWNGMLVMYAHGYRGTGSTLTVDNPPIRKWLLDNGYAWAASSYSANYYDVRAGLEDTNELALAFNDIAKDNGRPLAKPTKIYITGHSMGGHVTAAAVEDENYAAENHKVAYNGAVPMCGVVAGTFEFDYLTDFTFAAQYLAHEADNTSPPLDSFPATNFDLAKINSVMWDSGQIPYIDQTTGALVPGVPSATGDKLGGLVQNLTGGKRPGFEAGYTSYYWEVVMSNGGSDGTINGILNKPLAGNETTVYQLDNNPDLSTEEQALNSNILRIPANPDANRPRRDGLRWIPKVNGEFHVPVVSIHGLGDLYVPFRNEQIYRQRAEANGNGYWLVQRAIRASFHCDYTVQEQVDAFSAMVRWEQTGLKPGGDDVTSADVISQDDYGCNYTTTPTSSDSGISQLGHSLIPACPTP